ncbi:MAG: hypothetical protein COZ05_07010, partial [Armatimonadetes bacterium CG_4_10_14_3_um_filter_59_10]
MEVPLQFAFTAAIIVAGSFLQGVTGFAFGMVTMSLLPFLMTVKAATPLVAVLAVPNAASILWQTRQGTDLRKGWGLLSGLVFGVPIGVLFIAKMDNAIVEKALAVVLISVALQGLLLPPKVGAGMRPFWGPVAGLLGGMIGGAFNIGGAPIVVYVYRQNWSRETIIAVMQTVFLISMLYRLTFYALTGMLSATLFLNCLLLLPCIIVGSSLGVRCQHKIDVPRLRVVVNGVLV